MNIKVGSILRIKNYEAHVIGSITYKNTQDGNKTWTEYRLLAGNVELWLSVDDIYKEYSVSRADNSIRGRIGPQWHEVDRGHQVVRSCAGDVDVEAGDSADFIEFEDQTEEKTLSVEIWDDGTEYSRGEYIDRSEFSVIGYEKPRYRADSFSAFYRKFFITIMVLGILASLVDYLPAIPKHISKYLKSSENYQYVTSITGSADQKADVYQYTGVSFSDGTTTDDVAKDIITGIEGQTQSVTQEDDIANAPIAIVTDKEYCLVYHPEDDENLVYVQISNRKYNYTSDNSPYKSSRSTTSWYRSHYYSSSYSADSSTYKSTPSAYSSYSGDTIHDIGNGYYDSYSSSVRQSSINNRKSSSGGGK